jgi:predicted nucleic acid-binding protein
VIGSGIGSIFPKKLVAELNAYLISKGQPIEFQDVVIAASFLYECCDVLLTENKEHFKRLPNLKGKVMTPKEFYETK